MAPKVRIWPAHELAVRDGFPAGRVPAKGRAVDEDRAAELVAKGAALLEAPAELEAQGAGEDLAGDDQGEG